jgi:hypothetical protein
VQSGFYWLAVRNWAEIKGKQGGAQRISGEMGWLLAGRGLIVCGSVDVDF